MKSLEEEFDEGLEEEFDEGHEEEFDQGFDDEYQQDFEDRFGDGLDNGMEVVLDSQAEVIEQLAMNTFEQQGHEMWTDGWLVFANPEEQIALQNMGYQVVDREELEGIGQTLVTVIAPASFSFEQDVEIVRQQLESVTLLADVNHIYSYQQQSDSHHETRASDQNRAYQPANLLNYQYKANGESQITLGMLDTAVAVEHPALVSGVKAGNIIQKSFVGEGKLEPTGHGTEIAGILLGNSGDYQGLIADGRLYSASVFFHQQGKGDIATTKALLTGLNWLAQKQVPVINMSLTGPPNRLLSYTIDKLCAKGTIIAAAVGNEGPLSKPLFPAGYPCTVAVTAVDAKQQIYKRAVIGEHVDLASFGVDVQTLNHRGGYQDSDGTSLATAFVSAHLAHLATTLDSPLALKDNLQQVYRQCIDLGVNGRDPVYGRGLLSITPLTVEVTVEEKRK